MMARPFFARSQALKPPLPSLSRWAIRAPMMKMPKTKAMR